MNSTTRTYTSMPGTNNLNHLNSFHNISKLPPRHPTLWNFIQKTQKKHSPFNPYEKKPKTLQPSKATIRHPTQTKLNPHQQQLEGINIRPESDSLQIGFLNINGLYSKKEDRMLELVQYMTQHQIDIFGLAETNLHWNNG